MFPGINSRSPFSLIGDNTIIKPENINTFKTNSIVDGVMEIEIKMKSQIILESVSFPKQKKVETQRPPKKILLAELFEKFVDEEELDRHNRWKCGGCHRQVVALKTTRIIRTPPILIIHLKRFKQNYS